MKIARCMAIGGMSLLGGCGSPDLPNPYVAFGVNWEQTNKGDMPHLLKSRMGAALRGKSPDERIDALLRAGFTCEQNPVVECKYLDTTIMNERAVRVSFSNKAVSVINIEVENLD